MPLTQGRPAANARGRVVPPVVMDAHLGAADVTDRARARAYQEARALADSELAAHYLALRKREEARAEGDLDRTVGLAVILAERLIGETRRMDRHLIMQMAHAALAEARGARRVIIEACPLDLDELRANVSTFGFAPDCIEVRANPELASGSLLLQTDLGSLDARLSPQLERLAVALRHALRE